jgi:hypothetical protein
MRVPKTVGRGVKVTALFLNTCDCRSRHSTLSLVCGEGNETKQPARLCARGNKEARLLRNEQFARGGAEIAELPCFTYSLRAPRLRVKLLGGTE